MTHKHITEKLAYDWCRSESSWVVYIEGEDFPSLYSRIACFCREIDAKEYVQLKNHKEDVLEHLQDLRRHYSGVLGLLSECSTQVDNENRGMIIDAFTDANSINGLVFKKVVDHIEILGFDGVEIDKVVMSFRKDMKGAA